MARLKSKRLITEVDGVYCRKCMKIKKSTEFYSAVNLDIDSNNFMSICKLCISEIFEGCLKNSYMDLKEAIHKTCQIVDVAYMESVIDSLELHMETLGDKVLSKNLFSLYKSHLGKQLKLNPSLSGKYEYNGFTKNINNDEISNESEDFQEYLNDFWGEGLSFEDYEYLEKELARWKEDNSIGGNSDIVMIREICFTQLAIRNKRVQNLDVSKLQKQLQEILKTAALDPAKQNVASSGKNQEAFGVWIKDIEQKEPAEWWNENRELFKDVDNINEYFENFIVRPIKNFITRSRDFVIKSGENNETEIELNDSENESEK